MNKTVKIKPASYIYRVVHRIMEGDCQMDHGPFLVNIPAMEVDVFAVTNQQYAAFLQESGYKPKDSQNFLKHFVDGKCLPGDEKKPVVWVSQTDARAYAKFYGRRLPTDTEWQYLAAGDKKLKWPWGNTLDYKKCNVFSDEMTDVDSFPQGKSPFGLYNMCGNVWEMVDDTIVDGDRDHTFTLLRGGSFYRAPDYWHAEGGAIPNDYHLKMHLLSEALNRNATVGFRTLKEVQGND